MTGSSGGWEFNNCKKVPHVSPSGGTTLHPQSVRVLVVPTPRQHLVLSDLSL